MSKRYIKCKLTLDTSEEYELIKIAVKNLMFKYGAATHAGKILDGILTALLAHEWDE